MWSQAGSGKSPGNRNGGVTGRGGLRAGNSRAQKCRRRKKGNNGAEKRERRVREITQSSRGEEDSREEKSEKTEERREGRGVREGILRVERKRNEEGGSSTEELKREGMCREQQSRERR